MVVVRLWAAGKWVGCLLTLALAWVVELHRLDLPLVGLDPTYLGARAPHRDNPRWAHREPATGDSTPTTRTPVESLGIVQLP